jgi:hypothetical protein
MTERWQRRATRRFGFCMGRIAMFFRKKRTPTKRGPVREVAWDDDTVKWISNSERLNVCLTHICKTVSLGYSSSDRFNADPNSSRSTWDVYGMMTYPKFIPTRVSFTGTEEKQFGGFFYDRSDNCNFGGQKISLPMLGIWIFDPDEAKAQLLYSVLRDAIIGGEKYASIRFWKKKGDGLMTATDKEHGWSYESRYAITGMVAWPTVQVRNLPKWALPLDYHDFSLDALPEGSSDLEPALR